MRTKKERAAIKVRRVFSEERRERWEARMLDTIATANVEPSCRDLMRSLDEPSEQVVRAALKRLAVADRIESRRAWRACGHVFATVLVYRPKGAEPKAEPVHEATSGGGRGGPGLGAKDEKLIQANINAIRAKKIEEEEKTFWWRVEHAEWVGPRGRDRSIMRRKLI